MDKKAKFKKGMLVMVKGDYKEGTVYKITDKEWHIKKQSYTYELMKADGKKRFEWEIEKDLKLANKKNKAQIHKC